MMKFDEAGGDVELITQEQLQKLFSYDPLTGILSYKVRRRGRYKFERAAGSLNHGYVRVQVMGRKYGVHRLAWLYVYGTFPTKCIDHINRDTTDNRISNLREAEHAENMRNFGMYRNNTSGFKGVTWHPESGKWRALCRWNKKNYSLGLHETKEAASAAYVAFSKEKFAAFFNENGVTAMNKNLGSEIPASASLTVDLDANRARLQALADQHLADKREAAEVQRITGVAMPTLPYAELGALTDAADDDLWPTDTDIVDALVEAFNMDRPEVIARLAKFDSVSALAELEAA